MILTPEASFHPTVTLQTYKHADDDDESMTKKFSKNV